MAARPAEVFPWSVLLLLIDDHSRQFASKKFWQKSFMVQNQFKVQRVVMARFGVRRGRPQDRKNDRKTTGFTKPLRPELNFGKEKVKVW
jgi:hypothetical protein